MHIILIEIYYSKPPLASNQLLLLKTCFFAYFCEFYPTPVIFSINTAFSTLSNLPTLQKHIICALSGLYSKIYSYLPVLNLSKDFTKYYSRTCPLRLFFSKKSSILIEYFGYVWYNYNRHRYGRLAENRTSRVSRPRKARKGTTN